LPKYPGVKIDKTVKYCRIYPENKSLYFRFMVFPTRKAMLEFRKNCGHKGKCYAFVQELVVQKNSEGKWVSSRRIGDICVYRKEMSAGILAHEAVHAALLYYGRKYKKYSFNTGWGDAGFRQEEKIAEIVGNIMKQMVIFYHKLEDKK